MRTYLAWKLSSCFQVATICFRYAQYFWTMTWRDYIIITKISETYLKLKLIWNFMLDSFQEDEMERWVIILERTNSRGKPGFIANDLQNANERYGWVYKFHSIPFKWCRKINNLLMHLQTLNIFLWAQIRCMYWKNLHVLYVVIYSKMTSMRLLNFTLKKKLNLSAMKDP